MIEIFKCRDLNVYFCLQSKIRWKFCKPADNCETGVYIFLDSMLHVLYVCPECETNDAFLSYLFYDICLHDKQLDNHYQNSSVKYKIICILTTQIEYALAFL